MNKSIDEFFARKYDKNNYNCSHFVSEVWRNVVGDDITEKLCGFMRKDKVVSFDLRRKFERLDKPSSPCLVLMQRPKTPPHVGIFLDGKVFHLKENGAEYQPIDVATIGFKKIGFYR